LTQSAPDTGNNIPMLFEMPTAVGKERLMDLRLATMLHYEDR
jgi:hypothetical protein